MDYIKKYQKYCTDYIEGRILRKKNTPDDQFREVTDIRIDLGNEAQRIVMAAAKNDVYFLTNEIRNILIATVERYVKEVYPKST